MTKQPYDLLLECGKVAQATYTKPTNKFKATMHGEVTCDGFVVQKFTGADANTRAAIYAEGLNAVPVGN